MFARSLFCKCKQCRLTHARFGCEFINTTDSNMFFKWLRYVLSSSSRNLFQFQFKNCWYFNCNQFEVNVDRRTIFFQVCFIALSQHMHKKNNRFTEQICYQSWLCTIDEQLKKKMAQSNVKESKSENWLGIDLNYINL